MGDILKTCGSHMRNELHKSRKYAGDFEGICIQVSGCFVCGGDHESGKCDFLHHLEPIIRVEDTRILTYARLSLPSSLEIQDATDGTSAIVARAVFAKGTQFGPFKARHLSELSYATEFPIKVFSTKGKENDDGWYLDTSDENCSSWMCLVSPATSPKNQNLTCYQDNCYIYYVAMKDIQPGEQLRVYYAPYYAIKLGKVPFKINCPTKKDNKAKVVNKPEKHKENGTDKKIYKEMLLNKEVAGKLAEQLPAQKLGASLVPERWRCKVCGAHEASIVKYARHLMSHFKPLLNRTDKPRCHLCNLLLPTEKLLVKHKVEKHGLKLKKWCSTGVKNQLKQRINNDSESKIEEEMPVSSHEVLVSSGDVSVLHEEILVPPLQTTASLVEVEDSPVQMSISSSEASAAPQNNQVSSEEMPVSPQTKDFPEELTASSCKVPVLAQELPVVAHEMSVSSGERQPLTHALQIAHEEMQVTSSELQSSPQETQTILLATLPDPLFNNHSLNALLQDGQSDAIKSFFAQYQDVDGDLALTCSAKTDHETLQADLTKGSLSNFGLTSSDMFLQQDASSESSSRKNFEPVESDPDILSHISDRAESSLTNMLVQQVTSAPDVHIMIMTHSNEEGYSLNLTASQAEQFCTEACIERDQVAIEVQSGPVEEGSFTHHSEIPTSGVLAIVPQYVLTVPQEESTKKQEESGEVEGSNSAHPNRSKLASKLLEHGPPYNCDICHKEFHCSEYIYRHLRKHTGEFTCISCKMVFARKESLVNHPCFTAPDSIHFTCVHCNKTFLQKKMLNRHMLKHIDAYTCNDCQRVYSSEKAFQSHHCGKNTQEAGPYHCPICNREFQRRSNLNKHLPLHIEAHPCIVCGKKLRAGDAVSNHEAFCTQGKVLEATGSTPCPRCSAVFTQLTLYRQHVQQHTHPLSCDACGRRFKDSRLRKYHMCPGEVLCCDVCQEQFSTLSEFLSHQVCHGIPQFHCYECGYSFHNAESLSSCCHKSSAVCVTKKPRQENDAPNGDAAQVLVCQVCGETYKTAASLKSHMVLHGERKFECEVCHKRFFRKDVLQEHRAVHQEAQFPCPECNKLLKTKKSLDVHMLRHTGKKRFACSKCPKMFFQKINLMKHSVVHEPASSRQLICRCCSKTFSSREYLTQHELEHTQGRIFQCDVCDKNFVKKHLLKSHVKKYHGKQSYLCPYCNVTFLHWNSIRRHLESRRHSKQRDQCSAPDLDNRLLLQDGVTGTEILSVPTEPLQPMAEVSITTQIEGSEPSLDQPTTLLSAEESAMPINTYILEEGTVIQPEGGEGDILLYVLDTVPTTDTYEELT